MADVEEQHSLLNTKFPVLLPDIPELRLGKAEFDAYIAELLRSHASIKTATATAQAKDEADVDSMKTEPDEPKPDSGDIKESAFMTGLLADKAAVPSFDDRDGKMLTANADVAFSTSREALVDLFFELEDVVSASRLKIVLENAWKDDSDATLKIIWNARSIHLGKGSRKTFYRAVGWLAENHPATLITNLPWLVRPLIQKKALKKDEKKEGEVSKDVEMVDAKDADSDFEIIDEDGETEGQPERKKAKLEDEMSDFDVKYGVAHGYWKDLVNLLALAADDQLKVDGDPKLVLNVAKPKGKAGKRDWTEGRKKEVNATRHTKAVEKLQNNAFYKALHLSVARLFAEQLKTDLARLKSEDKSEKKRISLAAKWAPTHKGFHDQHTCIVSSIAELLHPFDEAHPNDRELALKHSRIAYQSQTLSPLRKHLEVVERPITAEKFDEIKYERVPSIAMSRYTPLFMKKDFDNFDKYIENVATGKAKISGATLLPSTLVAKVSGFGYGSSYNSRARGTDAMVDKKLHDLEMKVVDGQWNTLVQRIKDSGKLDSSIAVGDVSGSMSYPNFADGTTPMSSSVGLSLLIAEVTEPPFGGAFITFSQTPEVVRVGGKDDKRSFEEKVKYVMSSDWGGNTDFVAVFEKLILPMAIENKLSQEDMVKQVFVFSDMQFDSADDGDRWSSSFQRIQKKFKDAGYEMPMLIFWNLAGGYGDTAPKPVDATQEGTALVSGYSQGQLKMFLENGSFEDPEEDEKIETKEEDGGDEVLVEKSTVQAKQNPMTVVKKAISHEAYRMLKVVD